MVTIPKLKENKARPHRPACGIDILLQDKTLLASLAQKRIGIVTHQNALTQEYRPSAYALAERLGKNLRCILTPEHGWSGFVAEGVKVGDGFDPTLRLPIFSLYGEDKAYLEFIKNNIDLLLIDLQDVGLRCYTYVSTCAQLLEACSAFPLEVMICDRPNPLGPQIKGPSLDPRLRSLVGYVETPFQHGQTLGTLLSTFNQAMGDAQLPLTLILCQPYHQPYHYPWIPPSPNLPSWESVLLYPALVLLEGTNVSEGRGTSLPFTCLGAPELNSFLLIDYLNAMQRSGIHARPFTFTPQSGKFVGVPCQGVHLLLSDPLKLNAVELGIKIIFFLKENYPDFKWVDHKNKYFIDYLLGSYVLREGMEHGLTMEKILEELRV